MRAGAEGACPRQACPYRIHQMRAVLGRARSHGIAASTSPPRPASASRCEASLQAGWAWNASISTRCTGRRRTARRIEVLLGDPARPQSRGQGAGGGPLQPQRGAADRRPRRVGHVDTLAAAVLPAIRRELGRRSAALVRGARNRRHRLQPDAVRAAHRRLHGEAGAKRAARQRLALAQCRVHAAPSCKANLELAETMKAVGERHGTSGGGGAPSPGRSPGPASAAPSSARASAEPGRRLDRRGNAAPAPGRSRRDRPDHRAHRRGSRSRPLLVEMAR